MQKILFFLFTTQICFSQTSQTVKFSIFQNTYESGINVIEKRLIEDVKYENGVKTASIKYFYDGNTVIDTVSYMFRTDNKVRGIISKTGKSNNRSTRYFYDSKGNLEKINWDDNVLFYKNEFDKQGNLKSSKYLEPNTVEEAFITYKYHKNGFIKEKKTFLGKEEHSKERYNEEGKLIFFEQNIGYSKTERTFYEKTTSKIAYGLSRNALKIKTMTSTTTQKAAIKYIYNGEILATEAHLFNDKIFEKITYFYDAENLPIKIEHRNVENILFEEEIYQKQ